MYDVLFSCYEGVKEIYTLVMKYIMFATNPNIMYFNLAYNAGTIIKNITNLVMFFYAKEYTRVSDGFTFGLELG